MFLRFLRMNILGKCDISPSRGIRKCINTFPFKKNAADVRSSLQNTLYSIFFEHTMLLLFLLTKTCLALL